MFLNIFNELWILIVNENMIHRISPALYITWFHMCSDRETHVFAESFWYMCWVHRDLRDSTTDSDYSTSVRPSWIHRSAVNSPHSKDHPPRVGKRYTKSTLDVRFRISRSARDRPSSLVRTRDSNPSSLPSWRRVVRTSQCVLDRPPSWGRSCLYRMNEQTLPRQVFPREDLGFFPFLGTV